MLALTQFLAVGIVSLFMGKNGFASIPVMDGRAGLLAQRVFVVHYGMHTGYIGIGELTPEIGVKASTARADLCTLGLPDLGWGIPPSFWLTPCGFRRARPRSSCWCGQALTAVVLSLSMLVYAPFVLYCCTSMTELVNYALLMLYAGFCTAASEIRLACARGRAAHRYVHERVPHHLFPAVFARDHRGQREAL
jgi:hypothetical protein